jgi:CDP-glucose 4,6-dehydratase
MGGHDPYSSSKGCAELVTAAYRDSFFPVDRYREHGTAVATARAGNVIGGGDWAADRLIPDIVRAILAGQPVPIRNPNSIRPWQHVLEPLSGYLLLAQRLYSEGPDFASAWNFGPRLEDARPVSWIVDRMLSRWDGNAGWKAQEGEHPHEARYLKLDCAKAIAELGWRPRWNLECAIDALVEWYRAYAAKADLNQLTVRQIAQYSGAPAASASSGVRA